MPWDFEACLSQAVAVLQHQRRVSYWTLQVRFVLDDVSLGVLKEELLYVYLVVDDAGKGLIWVGDPAPPALEPPHRTPATSCCYTLFPEVMALLHRERRVIYRLLLRRWEQGKPEHACGLLIPVYNWCIEGFDLADVPEAKGLLAVLR